MKIGKRSCKLYYKPLREKFPNTGFFLVRIFPHSDSILRISPNSVQLRKLRTRKNFILGHFSRSENHVPIWANLRTLQVKQQVSEAVGRRHQSLKTSQTPQKNNCVWASWPATLLKRNFDTATVAPSEV